MQSIIWYFHDRAKRTFPHRSAIFVSADLFENTFRLLLGGACIFYIVLRNVAIVIGNKNDNVFFLSLSLSLPPQNAHNDWQMANVPFPSIM